jgi:multiple sugar transport system permease protein
MAIIGQNTTLTELEVAASPAVTRKAENEGQQLSTGQKIVTHLVLIILSLIFLVPFFWMITGSLKTDAQMSAFPITWLPNPTTLGNYVYGLQAEPFGLYIVNSLVICCFSIIGALFSSSFVAYGLARIDWPLRTPLFVVILSTTMIPFYVTMVPLFTLFRTMGWVNTYLPLILPSFFGIPFFIFLLRQFFMTIPKDLSEAAKVDGANELVIFFRVVLPLARPALAAIALFQFLSVWSDFLGPLIYLNDASKYTVSIGLTFFQGQYTTEYGALMAASTVMLVPVIILFFFAQKTFIQGITLTGVKG